MKKEIIRFCRKTVSRIDITLSSRIMYRAFMHQKLNLNPPVTFNEKLCWLKLNIFPKDPMIIQCADKYRVGGYLKQKGLDNLRVPLLGAWDTPEEIPWDTLPDQFVLKCNHGCAYNIICKDKKTFDKKEAVKKLKKWLKEDFGLVTAEPHYSKIRKKIICEEYLSGEIKDVKFFCFNGVPRFYYTASIKDGDSLHFTCDFYWPDGTHADFRRLDHEQSEFPSAPPENLSELKEIACVLSEDFPFVRVDLMNVGDKVYFSELTFTPSAGIMPLFPEGTDERIGKWLDLSEYKTGMD